MLALIDSEWGILLVVVAVLILFGGSKLPKFARSLGSAQSEFKKGLAEGNQPAATETPAPAPEQAVTPVPAAAPEQAPAPAATPPAAQGVADPAPAAADPTGETGASSQS